MNTYGKRALAAAVASLGAAALAPTASADTTLVLFEHDTVQHQVDLGGRGPGPGDQFIFAGDVFDRPGGAFLGTVAGSCTTLTGNDKAGQMACNGTFNLAGGQIVLQAVADTAALFVRGDGDVAWKDIIYVFDRLKAAGIEKVGVVTQPVGSK